MLLRPYQQAAVDAVYDYLRTHDDNPVVVLPPGSGKSWVIAQIATDAVTRWNGRVLVLAHMRELLEQNADKMRRLCPGLRVGLYSAGLGRRDTDTPILVAGIQSIYQRACDLDPLDLVIIDESHLLPLTGVGMFRTFLHDALVVNPQLRVVGMTATAFRTDRGPICTPEHFLNAVCFEANIKELIRDGYLCPLISKAGTTKVDTSSLSIRAGEFVAEEAERLMDQDAVVDAACAEIVALTKDRQCVLIFAAGVSHGQHVQRILQDRYGLECGFVCGETASGERDEILARFRGEAASGLFHAQPLKYLANANLLTTGFDSPRVDCVVLLRPTMSPGLVVQMVGRAFRLHPGKNDALVLDFGGNIQRHGPVDQIKAPHGNRTGSGGEAPAKECPQCHSVIAAGYARCPDCGYEFPEPEWGRHDATASTAGILTGQVTTTVFEVRDEQYSVHRKRGTPADAPRTMRVDYLIGLGTWKSEWVCFEHEGYARKKAEAWWRARADWPVPATAEEAVRLANEGLLRPTKTITVRQVAGDKYDRIIGCSLVTEHQAAAATADSLIPF